MGPVVYSIGVSLDGYIADQNGDIDWSAPDEELHQFHNQQTREVSVHLCGRRLYETMVWWETLDLARADPVAREFAEIWRAIPKVVFSTTLETVEGNARLARGTVADEVARARLTPGEGVVSVGGAGLAAALIELDLIDEYRQFVSPIVLGGGTPYFPHRAERLNLELLETRTFGSRVVYLRYQRVNAQP